MKTRAIKIMARRDFFKILTKYYSVPIADSVIILDNTKTPVEDRYVLEKAVKSIRPKIVLEIGTYLGETTLELAKNSPTSKIYTIDICEEMQVDIPYLQEDELLPRKKVGKAFRNKNRNIFQILGDSRQFSTYSFLNGKKIDFAFIDGNHSLEAVIQDTENVLNFMQKNSIIFWHDFRAEVREALSYLITKKPLEIFQIHKTSLAYSIL